MKTVNENENGATEEKKSITIELPGVNNIASKRSIVPILFAFTLLFFFFNFFTISCGNQEIASVTGVDMAFGKTIKTSELLSESDEDIKIPANTWAMIGLVAAFVGLLLFLVLRNKKESIYAAIAGAVGVISLLILRFSATFSSSEYLETPYFEMLKLKANMGYYLAVIAMLAATAVCCLRIKKENTSQKLEEEN